MFKATFVNHSSSDSGSCTGQDIQPVVWLWLARLGVKHITNRSTVRQLSAAAVKHQLAGLRDSKVQRNCQQVHIPASANLSAAPAAPTSVGIAASSVYLAASGLSVHSHVRGIDWHQLPRKQTARSALHAANFTQSCCNMRTRSYSCYAVPDEARQLTCCCCCCCCCCCQVNIGDTVRLGLLVQEGKGKTRTQVGCGGLQETLAGQLTGQLAGNACRSSCRCSDGRLSSAAQQREQTETDSRANACYGDRRMVAEAARTTLAQQV
jgi:hypothetical protein